MQKKEKNSRHTNNMNGDLEQSWDECGMLMGERRDRWDQMKE